MEILPEAFGLTSTAVAQVLKLLEGQNLNALVEALGDYKSLAELLPEASGQNDSAFSVYRLKRCT